MIWLGIILLCAGAYMRTQNTSSALAAPLMVIGVIVLIVKLMK